MVFPLAALALPAVMGAGAGLNYFSARDANRTNEALANKQMGFQQASTREQMEFQASQAATAREFDERMANTQVQRRMADLQAAGINPLLAGTDGAASPTSPAMSGASSAGAMAHVDAVESIPSRLFAGAQAIQQVAKAGEQIDLYKRDVTSKEIGNKINESKSKVLIRSMEVLDRLSSSAMELFNKYRGRDLTPGDGTPNVYQESKSEAEYGGDRFLDIDVINKGY